MHRSLCVMAAALIASGVLLWAGQAKSYPALDHNPMLVPSSIGKKAATDGTDLGANFDINAVIRRATSGIPTETVPVPTLTERIDEALALLEPIVPTLTGKARTNILNILTRLKTLKGQIQ